MRTTYRRRTIALVSAIAMVFAAVAAFGIPASAAKDTYHHYVGLIHSHTGNSDGTGSYGDAYGMARQAGLDFFACTEHSDGLDNAAKAGETRWADGLAAADRYTENGKFVAIMAYEMTWQGDVGYNLRGLQSDINLYGHMNVFNTRDYEIDRDPRYDDRVHGIGLQNFYDDLAKLEGAIGQFDHPNKFIIGNFRDFAYWTPARDKNINLIEIGNGSSPTPLFDFAGFFRNGTAETYLRYESSYNLALAKGWHVGPTNGQDNHNANWAVANPHRTMLLAKELTRPALYDAMANRRVYTSEDGNMRVDFTINGEVMGTVLDHSPARLDVRVKATTTTANIGLVMLIGENGRVVRAKAFRSKTADWEFSIPASQKYYYVKICPSFTFTAPIWVKEN